MFRREKVNCLTSRTGLVTSVNEFVTHEVLTMTKLHLAVTTRETFAGTSSHLAVADVRLQLSDRVEVALAHVAAIQSQKVVASASRSVRVIVSFCIHHMLYPFHTYAGFKLRFY